MADVNPFGGSGTKEARDTFCTPRWMAELIGRVRLDPCSNLRSHIQADLALSLENGDDGLLEDEGLGAYLLAADLDVAVAGSDWSVFVNPPYARGQVIRWVRHYLHTDFIFLLRFDPSTCWYAELCSANPYVWFPRKRRIEFEPPPGVKVSKNPFPHALYLRSPPNPALAAAGYTYRMLDLLADHEHSHLDGSVPTRLGVVDANRSAEGGAGGAGSRAEGAGGWLAERGICPSCGRRSSRSSVRERKVS